MSAAENVGRVLAQRCLECGITNVFYGEDEDQNPSEKVNSLFLLLHNSLVVVKVFFSLTCKDLGRMFNHSFPTGAFFFFFFNGD